VLVDVSELHLGGGSIRCLTNPLDIVVGRDLPAVPGGDVVRSADRSSQRSAMRRHVQPRQGGMVGHGCRAGQLGGDDAHHHRRRAHHLDRGQ
jgi:hypothetical protein